MTSFRNRLTQVLADTRTATSRRRRIDLRGADAEFLQVLALQSGDADRIRRVLDPGNPLTHAVAAHVIPLLGTESVARDAVRALQAAAEQHAGKLVDTLLDTQQPVNIRRRVARVLSVCRSQRAADGLMLGLRDGHRDVRTQCGRALLLMSGRDPMIRIDDGAIYEAVLRETSAVPVDLTLVFTMLALVLPRRTIRGVYRAFRSADDHLWGTALEYLHHVLRPDVRVALGPHLEQRSAPGIRVSSATGINTGETSD